MGMTVFGIWHHGPACARSLRRALDESRPDVVVIEGAPDADGLLPLRVHTRPLPRVDGHRDPQGKHRRLGRPARDHHTVNGHRFQSNASSEILCLRMKSSASARVKTPAVVPTERTQLAPTALASFRHSSSERPSSSPTM
jgi:hypothetical protein